MDYSCSDCGYSSENKDDFITVPVNECETAIQRCRNGCKSQKMQKTRPLPNAAGKTKLSSGGIKSTSCLLPEQDTVNNQNDQNEVDRKEFAVDDFFNPGNKLKGYIYTDEDRYGDLLITAVNGIPCEQYIRTTPKFNYPPDNKKLVLQELLVYDKLDGTNICMYSYLDHEGNRYWTYKTRLSPVIKSNKFGNFLEWSVEMITQYQQFLEVLQRDEAYNYSLELYGAINEVLIAYDIRLDLKYLFKIDTRGNLYPPAEHEEMAPECIEAGGGNKKLMELVAELRDALEKQYENNPSEGVMIYGKTSGGMEASGDNWAVYKCKPEQIFAVMAGKNAVISKKEIETTMKNALELCEDESEIEEITAKLLGETYDIQVIHNSTERITKVKERVLEQIAFRDKVMTAVKTCPHEIKLENKGLVMRWIASNNLFSGVKASKVYNALFRYS